MPCKDPEKKREYHRKWYMAHREEVLERGRMRYEANSEKLKEDSRRWQEDNPEKCTEYVRKYHAAHREEMNEKSRAYYAANPEKKREAARKFKAAHPDRIRVYCEKYQSEHPDRLKAAYRKHRLKKFYGITPEQFSEMLERQGGVCAVCGKPPNGRGCVGRNLHVDHDHTTGVVRGLLCSACNLGIGKLCDDAGIIQRAADYVRGGAPDGDRDSVDDSRHSCTADVNQLCVPS